MQPSPKSILDVFITPERNPDPNARHTLFRPEIFQPWAINLLPVPTDSPLLDVSYKWDHTVYDFWNCLLSLSSMFSRFSYVSRRIDCFIILLYFSLSLIIFLVLNSALPGFISLLLMCLISVSTAHASPALHFEPL